VVADFEAPDAFYRAEEGGEFFNAFISGKKEEGQHPFWKEKGACGEALGSHAEGRLEGVAARRRVAMADYRSRATSRLTRGGRQPVGSVRPKDCLH
jgi:hypothetical protein